MGLIKVYSKSPISHSFVVNNKGNEETFIIQGLNYLDKNSNDKEKVTEIEEEIYNLIKKKYSSHANLFSLFSIK